MATLSLQYYYYHCNYYCYDYDVGLSVDSRCVRGRELWPVLTVLPHTRHQMTLLSYCPALFCAKHPCLVLNNQQLKVYRTRFSYSSISPLSIKANLWLANMCTWSHTNTPYLGSGTSDQELKKKKIPKPTPPINPGLFFLGQTAQNFPKAATKKRNDQQKQGNSRNKRPADPL